MPYADLTKRRIYGIWNQMKRRCYIPSNISYKNYGAKGIKVCDNWRDSFNSFYNWATLNGYSNDLTLDRIDCQKDYSPENCRWVTMKIQNNNKNNNVIIEKDGIKKTATEWAKFYKLTADTIFSRLKQKCDSEHLFLSNEDYLKFAAERDGVPYGGHIIEFNGEKHNISEWARIYNINRQTLKKRLFEHNSPFEKAILSKEEYKKYRKSLK